MLERPEKRKRGYFCKDIFYIIVEYMAIEKVKNELTEGKYERFRYKKPEAVKN